MPKKEGFRHMLIKRADLPDPFRDMAASRFGSCSIRTTAMGMQVTLVR
jgi:hypothetical protein